MYSRKNRKHWKNHMFRHRREDRDNIGFFRRWRNEVKTRHVLPSQKVGVTVLHRPLDFSKKLYMSYLAMIIFLQIAILIFCDG